jgi:hypothetical protein
VRRAIALPLLKREQRVAVLKSDKDAVNASGIFQSTWRTSDAGVDFSVCERVDAALHALLAYLDRHACGLRC